MFFQIDKEYRSAGPCVSGPFARLVVLGNTFDGISRDPGVKCVVTAADYINVPGEVFWRHGASGGGDSQINVFCICFFSLRNHYDCE